ncbi:hypothetical protein [Dialister micraerophilus]|nr:hypothetical protein [Dialister micraerophilus]
MGVRVPSLAPMAIWKHIAFKLLFNAKRQMNSADGKNTSTSKAVHL